ncbi:phospholipid-transporting ATPase 1-like [Iris pallida]|uniref:Phospholipid-transporting ATPase n=1 Tax=Iris pallida TaxID=29817 RepID=A0AAX6EIP5_IRIPA|nr:phospholipid-transporting ATPase 1-like [Iris pallida]
MNPDQPLLHSSSHTADSAPPLAPTCSNLGGSFHCLCPTGSFSSSNFEDSNSLSPDTIEEEKAIPLEERKSSARHIEGSNEDQFQSAESSFFQRFLLECPAQQGRHLVSWGTREMEGVPSSLEISVSTGGQEKVDRSQRARHRSMQFEDAFSSDDDPRLIYINDPKKTNDEYDFTGNEIRTSKYTVITFLPKNLFIQFHRVAYLYFLAIAGLNQLPPLAVFGRTVSLFPLLFVLFVTAIKDGYEDWRRHRSDRKENNREAQVLQFGKFRMKKWKKIRVGEVMKIYADESVPCDMVLLGSSDPNGIAYIQTMNLDGESNLKTRYARQETAPMILGEGSYSGLIRCEQPNRNIYEFTANMEYNGHRVPLGQSNIILRGCQLKNTDWVVGVVVYAGQETKAMLNSAVSPSKRSRLESYMNRETFWLSVFLFVMCSVVATGMGLWLYHNRKKIDTLPYYRRRYFTNGRDNGKVYKYYGLGLEILFSFLSSVIVFQIMIPISLYISMELVRLGQSYFMIGDTQMYDSNSDSRFQCRSLNINEDLGQIRYIFSDKTGTLTENKMEFRRASVYGVDYGDSLQVTDQRSLVGRRWKLNSEVNVDSELVKLLHKDIIGEERIAAHEFFLALAACNTVIPMTSKSTSRSSANEEHDVVDTINYQGESPDEQALVTAASAYGYTLMERTSGHIVVDVNGEETRLDVLGLHEFDSVRKRMSVVIRFPSNAVKVLVKGADSSMLGIIDISSDNGCAAAESAKIKHATENHLTCYSSQGLRTLVIASRDLTDAEFEEWQEKYEEASTSLTERQAKLRQAAALIECRLNLLGATAIEDKLQEGVPETIESLRQAGIKVWVLTGDKQETAISIGLSCKLLTQNMQQIIINGNSEAECRRLLGDAKTRYGIKSVDCSDKIIHSMKNADSTGSPRTTKSRSQATGYAGGASEMSEFWGEKAAPLALIIDGNSLVYILEKDLESEARTLFLIWQPPVRLCFVVGLLLYKKLELLT